MSRHHPLLAVMLVVVRVTVTHHTVPHLTVVSSCQERPSPGLHCRTPSGVAINRAEGPSCSKQPKSVGPVCSAVRSNPIVIPNQVGFVKLSQVGVFVDSMNNIRGCKTQGCDGNLVPDAVKSTRLGGGLSVLFGCAGCKVKSAISFTKDLLAIMISVYVCKSHLLLPAALMLCIARHCKLLWVEYCASK